MTIFVLTAHDKIFLYGWDQRISLECHYHMISNLVIFVLNLLDVDIFFSFCFYYVVVGYIHWSCQIHLSEYLDF